ncbi:MAG: M23 family metallopeptidase [Bacteroidales bacterium]|nr:M23 family metallopeptidase [Bacteroidales bacterium]
MENLFGRKYSLNPETLRFEEDTLSRNKKLTLLIILGVAILLTSVGMRVVYDQHAKTPRLIKYEKQNEELRRNYKKLHSELKQDELILTELRRKDDRLYRSIFGMEPLPSSIREAGTGGSETYTSLQSISNPNMIIDVFDKIDKILMKAKIQHESFDDLENAALEQIEILASKPLIHPLSPADRFWFTSAFGYRNDPFTRNTRYHHGIDISGRKGLKIHATGDGTVELAKFNRFGYGKEVIINHGFGYKSRYAHMDNILVDRGQKVKRGQVIGTLGNSGRSTGPHLHYEIRLNNKAINPVYYYFENLSPEEYEMITLRAKLD